MSDDLSRVLVMVDGDLPSLVAAMNVREGVVAMGERVGTGAGPVLWPAVGRDEAGRIAACRKMAGRTKLELVQRRAWSVGPRDSVWASPSRLLLDACTDAAALGLLEVVWPVQFPSGGGMQLELASRAADRALLVTRLMSLDAGAHGVPALRVDLPMADLTDVEVAELAVDLGVGAADLACCWWWGRGEEAAEREAAFGRWAAALRAAGWQAGSDPEKLVP